LKPVVLDQRLVQAAGTSARYQASRGRIGHRGPGGSRPWDRARSAGYSPHLTAENVASGQKSFGEAMRGWEHSAEHKRNLLLPDAQAAGIAVTEPQRAACHCHGATGRDPPSPRASAGRSKA
jgi:uncharacterized protein YkwD